jgi:membrane protease YdiL (CAAX protease family)
MPTRRIPHLGHALLFLVLLLAATLGTELVALGLSGAFKSGHAALLAIQNQRLQLIVNMVSYLVALAFCWFTFPALWGRSFLDGIQWNASAIRPLLALAGVLLGLTAEAASTLLPIPKQAPLEDLFRNPALIWLLAIFGTFLAPLFEEIFFRGFLLPGIAIAVDYLSLPRPVDPMGQPDRFAALANLDAWRGSDAYSTRALVTASILTSICFGLIHAPQLGLSWPSVALLMTVSLVLCYVRLRFRSVAASTLIHACYNFFLFATIFLATGGFRHLDRAV